MADGSFSSLSSAGRSYSLTIYDATATGRIQYVQGVSYTAPASSGTATVVTSISGGSGSLTSNDTASGGIAYIASATAPTLSGDAAPNGHTHSITVSGTTGANSGTAVAAVTGYGSFSGGSGSFSATRSTSGSGDTARRTLTFSHTHTAASLGSPSTSNVAPNNHTHSYGSSTALTSSTNSGTKVTLSGGAHTTKYLHHTHTAASSDGSATVLTGITSGSVTTTTKYLELKEN